MLLEGFYVSLEEHGEPGQLGSYRRIVVTCPHGEHRGTRPCMKKRNIGVNQSRQFGELEPFAYLGAWLKARDSFLTTRTEHMRYMQCVDTVRAYAAAQGWLA